MALRLGQKKAAHIIGALINVLFFSVLMVGSALANPEGGTVVSGSAIIEQQPNYTQITQQTDKAIIDWQSFSIQQNEHTHFQQPSSSSVALNRVIGRDPSAIYGRLTANGRIMLINRAGILFAPNSQVDVGGLIASTADISNEDFLAGRYRFQQAPDTRGSVINQGSIKVADEGLVALMGNAVANQGVIEAKQGNVVLAAGESFDVGTVDFYGDDLIHLAVTQEISQPGVNINGEELPFAVSNSGVINADGGRVLMTAKAAAGVVDNVINMDGVIEADTIEQKGGEIVLLGDDYNTVSVSGKLIAQGDDPGEVGGQVTVTGHDVQLVSGSEINVSGDSGGGEILVGGDFQGQGDLARSDNTFVDNGVVLFADAIRTGDGGRIIVWSDGVSEVYGSLYARGGSEGGDGGFIETSGKLGLGVLGQIDVSAANGEGGTWLLDPDIMIVGDPDLSATGASNPVNCGLGVNTCMSIAVSVINDVLDSGSNVTLTGEIVDVVQPIVKSAGGNSLLVVTGSEEVNLLGAGNIINSSGSILDIVLFAGNKISVTTDILNAGAGMINLIAELSVSDSNSNKQMSFFNTSEIVTGGGDVILRTGIDLPAGSFDKVLSRIMDAEIYTNGGTVLFEDIFELKSLAVAGIISLSIGVDGLIDTSVLTGGGGGVFFNIAVGELTPLDSIIGTISSTISGKIITNSGEIMFNEVYDVSTLSGSVALRLTSTSELDTRDQTGFLSDFGGDIFFNRSLGQSIISGDFSGERDLDLDGTIRLGGGNFSLNDLVLMNSISGEDQMTIEGSINTGGGNFNLLGILAFTDFSGIALSRQRLIGGDITTEGGDVSWIRAILGDTVGAGANIITLFEGGTIDSAGGGISISHAIFPVADFGGTLLFSMNNAMINSGGGPVNLINVVDAELFDGSLLQQLKGTTSIDTQGGQFLNTTSLSVDTFGNNSEIRSSIENTAQVLTEGGDFTFNYLLFDATNPNTLLFSLLSDAPIDSGGGLIEITAPVEIRDGGNVTVNADDGSVVFEGTVDSQTPGNASLIINAGDIVFEQPVGSINKLDALTLNIMNPGASIQQGINDFIVTTTLNILGGDTFDLTNDMNDISNFAAENVNGDINLHNQAGAFDIEGVTTSGAFNVVATSVNPSIIQIINKDIFAQGGMSISSINNNSTSVGSGLGIQIEVGNGALDINSQTGNILLLGLIIGNGPGVIRLQGDNVGVFGVDTAGSLIIRATGIVGAVDIIAALGADIFSIADVTVNSITTLTGDIILDTEGILSYVGPTVTQGGSVIIGQSMPSNIPFSLFNDITTNGGNLTIFPETLLQPNVVLNTGSGNIDFKRGVSGQNLLIADSGHVQGSFTTIDFLTINARAGMDGFYESNDIFLNGGDGKIRSDFVAGNSLTLTGNKGSVLFGTVQGFGGSTARELTAVVPGSQGVYLVNGCSVRLGCFNPVRIFLPEDQRILDPDPYYIGRDPDEGMCVREANGVASVGPCPKIEIHETNAQYVQNVNLRQSFTPASIKE